MTFRNKNIKDPGTKNGSEMTGLNVTHRTVAAVGRYVYALRPPALACDRDKLPPLLTQIPVVQQPFCLLGQVHPDGLKSSSTLRNNLKCSCCASSSRYFSTRAPCKNSTTVQQSERGAPAGILSVISLGGETRGAEPCRAKKATWLSFAI